MVVGPAAPPVYGVGEGFKAEVGADNHGGSPAFCECSVSAADMRKLISIGWYTYIRCPRVGENSRIVFVFDEIIVPIVVSFMCEGIKMRVGVEGNCACRVAFHAASVRPTAVDEAFYLGAVPHYCGR